MPNSSRVLLQFFGRLNGDRRGCLSWECAPSPRRRSGNDTFLGSGLSLPSFREDGVISPCPLPVEAECSDCWLARCKSSFFKSSPICPAMVAAQRSSYMTSMLCLKTSDSSSLSSLCEAEDSPALRVMTYRNQQQHQELHESFSDPMTCHNSQLNSHTLRQKKLPSGTSDLKIATGRFTFMRMGLLWYLWSVAWCVLGLTIAILRVFKLFGGISPAMHDMHHLCYCPAPEKQRTFASLPDVWYACFINCDNDAETTTTSGIHSKGHIQLESMLSNHDSRLSSPLACNHDSRLHLPWHASYNVRNKDRTWVG